MITEALKKLLHKHDFVYVATSDADGHPNVAPKYLVKFEGVFLYLVDYVIGRTWENLKVNPQAAVSLMDTETLTGYQLKGKVSLITTGPEFTAIVADLEDKHVAATVERVIEGIRRAKKHHSFDLALPSNSVVYKLKVDEVIEIGSSGTLKREKI